jgi:hypothetical protein
VLIRDCHRSLSWDRWIQCASSNPISIRSILILSCHLRVGIPSGLFTSASQPKCLHISHLAHTCYMPRPSHPPWSDNPNSIWWRVQIMKHLIMLFSPPSSHFIPLRPKYSIKCRVLKDPKSAHLPALYFLVNTILYCYCRPQIFEVCHILKGFICYNSLIFWIKIYFILFHILVILRRPINWAYYNVV